MKASRTAIVTRIFKSLVSNGAAFAMILRLADAGGVELEDGGEGFLGDVDDAAHAFRWRECVQLGNSC